MSAPIKGLQLAALKIATREMWRQVVVSTICEHRGELRAAAKELDIVERTIHRWVREDDVKAALIEAKKKDDSVVLPAFLQKEWATNQTQA